MATTTSLSYLATTRDSRYYIFIYTKSTNLYKKAAIDIVKYIVSLIL